MRGVERREMESLTVPSVSNSTSSLTPARVMPWGT